MSRPVDQAGTGVGGSGDESRTGLEAVLPPIDVAPLVRGGTLGGRYEILGVIGRGGMGLVVEAHDRTLGEKVAIKIIRAELGEEREWVERLAREVKLARTLHHPNVCRVFDFEQADGRAFLVMELAPGGSLRRELRAAGYAERPFEARLDDARAIARGLAAIHAAGIVHRDVSPQNTLRMLDGRLVVSDFGLATDSAESTTNLHGGTVAYIAPELARGGRARFASDVWALGVVIHEVVFGIRPRWREPAGVEMLSPIDGRPLTRPEAAVLEICRACTAADPAARIPCASEVGQRLTEEAFERAATRRTWRRALAAAGLGLGALALLVGARHFKAAHVRAAAVDPLMIVPTGLAEDWTERGRVLAEIPELLSCMVGLPDRRTVRLVWGQPPRAEDVDTSSGLRSPSPLLPAAYAEGCPDLAPDGRHLVFQGHTADGRPFAFMSDFPDGRDATPVVQTAEPSSLSDPAWLADGSGFAYDADASHPAVYSTVTHRSTILPQAGEAPFFTSFHYAAGPRVLVTALGERHRTTVAAFDWPNLQTAFRFDLPEFAFAFRYRDERTVFATLMVDGPLRSPLIAIDPIARTARRLGFIRDQDVREQAVVENGLAFVSLRHNVDAALRAPDGTLTPITRSGWITSVAPCGPRLVGAELRGANERLVYLDRAPGGPLVDAGREGKWPICSPDGRTLYYVDWNDGLQLIRCDGPTCGTLVAGSAALLSMSPDGSRLAFVTLPGGVAVVDWMSSNGGPIHRVSETETVCRPGWSSNRALWVSRRRGRNVVWVEVDADTARETGRTTPGQQDCSSGAWDPISPVDPDLRLVSSPVSQLRLVDWQRPSNRP